MPRVVEGAAVREQVPKVLQAGTWSPTYWNAAKGTRPPPLLPGKCRLNPIGHVSARRCAATFAWNSPSRATAPTPSGACRHRPKKTPKQNSLRLCSCCTIYALRLARCGTGRARCADNLLYDEPPCTDYAEPRPYGPGYARYPHDNLISSPEELFQTIQGLPFMLTLGVLLLHLTCCTLQWACGAGDDGEDRNARSPHAVAMRESLERTTAAAAGAEASKSATPRKPVAASPLIGGGGY